MRLLRLILATVFAAASVVANAYAQSAIPLGVGQRRADEAGLRLGGIELHPAVNAEVGYDSNYFRRSGVDLEEDGEVISAEAPIVHAWRFRVTPSLSLVTPPTDPASGQDLALPPKLVLRASTYAAYSEMLSTGGEPVNSGEQRRLDLGIASNLSILPERIWGGDIGVEYLRISEPSGSDDPLLGWERETASFGAGVSWRPLGGVLRWRLGYLFRYNWYQKTFQELNNFEQAIQTRGSFRFLPRTAFFYEGQYSFLRYQYLSTDQNHGDSIQTRLGLNTHFSNRISLVGAAGWAATYRREVGNAEVHNYDGLVLTAEGKYFLQPQPQLRPGDTTVGISSLFAGAVRDYANSYLGDYYERTRGYSGLDYGLGGRIVLKAQVGISRISHPAFYLRQNRIELNPETRYDLLVAAEYRVLRTIAAIASVSYEINSSKNQLFVEADPADPNSRPFGDDLAYSRLQLWVGGRWFM